MSKSACSRVEALASFPLSTSRAVFYVPLRASLLLRGSLAGDDEWDKKPTSWVLLDLACGVLE